MSDKPDEIPQDVWDAAEGPAQAVYSEAFLFDIASGDGQYLDSQITTGIIARAIMAERERCASVAWIHGASSSDPYVGNAGYVIAAAIRSTP